MKITDLSGLYVGYNEVEDFRVLICAIDKTDAQCIADSYLSDMGMEGNFELSTFSDINTEFDCDLVLTLSY